jgi:hypothetical protein
VSDALTPIVLLGLARTQQIGTPMPQITPSGKHQRPARVQLRASGFHAPVAQWIEHRPSKPRVAGSTPAGRANLRSRLPTRA